MPLAIMVVLPPIGLQWTGKRSDTCIGKSLTKPFRIVDGDFLKVMKMENI